MITFLRRLRRSFLDTGAFRKYFLYAVGEILLVVIGILIALQINNWNERNKTNSKVNELLIALQQDLSRDTLLILDNMPFILDQYQFNESLRAKVAKPDATLDTLIQVMHHEFNPNWRAQITYNSNAYNSLNQTGLIEHLPDGLKTSIKNFYNRKSTLRARIEKTTNDYQGKITSYVDTYTFGSTEIHDQGPLIDRLVWKDIDPGHLAATFQGISNFKRILFTETREELDYSLTSSRKLIAEIENYLNFP